MPIKYLTSKIEYFYHKNEPNVKCLYKKEISDKWRTMSYWAVTLCYNICDFRGIDTMKEKFQILMDKLRQTPGLFGNKKAAKGASITYQVIWNLTLLFIILAVVGGSFAGGLGAGYFASLVKDEPIRSYASMKKIFMTMKKHQNYILQTMSISESSEQTLNVRKLSLMMFRNT